MKPKMWENNGRWLSLGWSRRGEASTMCVGSYFSPGERGGGGEKRTNWWREHQVDTSHNVSCTTLLGVHWSQSSWMKINARTDNAASNGLEAERRRQRSADY